jgi:hypothetical protein
VSFDSDFGDILTHTVTVETFTATTPTGNTYATPVVLTGFLERKRRLVLSATGEQVISESTFYTDPANAARLVTKSRVTVPGERPTIVIRCSTFTSNPDLDLPDHVEAALQ